MQVNFQTQLNYTVWCCVNCCSLTDFKMLENGHFVGHQSVYLVLWL